MALPANIKYGIVTANFIKVTADNSDPDREPQAIPLEGIKVKFVADTATPIVTDAVDGVTVFLDTVYGISNAAGVLVPADPTNPTFPDAAQVGVVGIPLLAQASSNIDPDDWTWTATVTTLDGKEYSFSFILTDAGGNLARLVPESPTPGTDVAAWTAVVSIVQDALADTIEARDAAIAAAGSGGGGAPAQHTHVTVDITDTTTVGKAVMKAVDAAAARTAIGAQASGSYAAATHTHTASGISDSTTIGRSVLTAADAAAVRTAIGAQVAGSYQASGSYAAATHTHTATDISNSTAVGRSVITAADAAAARTAIGAGTSNVAIGTTTGTAADAGALATNLAGRPTKNNQIDHIFWNKTTRVWTPHDLTYGTHHCHSENDATAEAPDGYGDFDIWWKRSASA